MSNKIYIENYTLIFDKDLLSINNRISFHIENENHLKNFINSYNSIIRNNHYSHDAIIIFNEYQDIIYCNLSSLKLFEYSLNEFLGLNLSFLLGSFKRDHDKHFYNFSSSNKKTQTLNNENVYGYTKSGEKKYLNIVVSKIKIFNKDCYKTSIRDISSLLRKYNALKKEIFDHKESLIYASNLQKKVNFDEQKLKAIFPKVIDIYMPLNHISGDITWGCDHPNFGKIISLIDCMGHGISGSLISMTAINCFKLHSNINTISGLKFFIANVIKDYMKFLPNFDYTFDCSVISYKDNILTIQGIKQKVILIRNNIVEKYDLYRGDIFSFEDDLYEIQDVKLKVKKGDKVFIFSDGYTDQFGGENNKKIKISGLIQLLENNKKSSLKDQKKILLDKIRSYISTSDIGQVDDITLIGIEL